MSHCQLCHVRTSRETVKDKAIRSYRALASLTGRKEGQIDKSDPLESLPVHVQESQGLS